MTNFFSLVTLIRPLSRSTNGANIYTLETIWPSQQAISEMLTLYPK